MMHGKYHNVDEDLADMQAAAQAELGGIRHSHGSVDSRDSEIVQEGLENGTVPRSGGGLSQYQPPLLPSSSHPHSHSAKHKLEETLPKLAKTGWAQVIVVLVIVLVVTIISFLAGQASVNHESHDRSSFVVRRGPVIMLSFDGFRYDYVDDPKLTPNMHRLMQSRHTIHAHRLIPQFPSLTFPNHWTLVTGLHAESHGIVSNHMIDPKTGARFDYQNHSTQFGGWYLGRPIWSLASDYSIPTGTVFWVGSEVPDAEGKQPDHWLPYDENMPNDARADQIFSWLDSGACSLCLGYFSVADDMGHAHGPNSPEVKDAISQLDEVVGRVIDGLMERGRYEEAAIVLVGDHGMADVNKRIFLDRAIDISPERGLIQTSGGPFLAIWTPLPVTDHVELIAETLRNLSTVEHLTCWTNIHAVWATDPSFTPPPSNLHYSTSDRIAPISCAVDEGFVTSCENCETSSPWHFPNSLAGVHGYRPDQSKSMSSFMLAHAPRHIDSGTEDHEALLDTWSNVNVFNLVAHILGISPSQNNGTLAEVAKYLRTTRV